MLSLGCTVHLIYVCRAHSSVTVYICTGNSHKSSIYFTTSVDRSMVKDGIPHVCMYVCTTHKIKICSYIFLVLSMIPI